MGVTGLLPLGRLQSDRGSTWTSDLGPVRTWNQEMLTTRHRVPSRKSTQQPAANEHQDAPASPTGPFPLPSWAHRPALGVLLPDLTACCPLIACPSPPWHAQLCPPGCPGTTPCICFHPLSCLLAPHLPCSLTHRCPAPAQGWPWLLRILWSLNLGTPERGWISLHIWNLSSPGCLSYGKFVSPVPGSRDQAFSEPSEAISRTLGHSMPVLKATHEVLLQQARPFHGPHAGTHAHMGDIRAQAVP